jgi:hypothetical protein
MFSRRDAFKKFAAATIGAAVAPLVARFVGTDKSASADNGWQWSWADEFNEKTPIDVPIRLRSITTYEVGADQEISESDVVRGPRWVTDGASDA